MKPSTVDSSKTGVTSIREENVPPAPVGRLAHSGSPYLPAWLPIPLLLVGMVVLWAADLRTSYGSPSLLIALNIVFSTQVSLFIAFLIGRSFLLRATPGLLLLGCGVLIWGAVNVVSVAVGRADVNANVTIYNTAACMAALCHLVGALLSLRPRRAMRAPGIWLAASCIVVLGAIVWVTHAAFAHWMPTFFIQGQGGTPLRQFVLGSAIVMFVLAALVLRAANRRSLSPFLNWYTLALLLIAAGLLGVMGQSSFGSALNWTGRAAQYLGGVYMLIAAIVSVRDSREWGISLEVALDEARQRYADLFDLAADGILVHEAISATTPGKVLQANSAIGGLLGYSAPEMQALTLMGMVAKEDRQALLHDSALTTGDGVLRHEKTLIGKDKRRIAVEISTRLFQHQGRPMAMSVIRDITERKLAEERVRELSQRLTYHVDNSPLAVVEFGPDMRLTRWSGEAEHLFGWKAEEVLGKRGEEFHWVHDQDQATVAEVVASLQQGAALRRSLSNRNYRKDGSVVHCEWYNSTLLDDSGKMQSLMSQVLDVTARKEAEAKLEEAKRLLDALMEYVPEGITVADAPDMRVQLVSRYGWELLGGDIKASTLDQIAARWKVYHRDGITPMAYADLPLTRAIRNGETVQDQEVVQVNETGQRLPLLCNAAPIRDSAGVIVGGVVAWRDLTDHKRAEERLRQAQKLESIGLLAGGIAHDFNNILVGVIGNASLALDWLPSGHPATELLEHVVKSGEHAAHLTRQMLAYAGKGRFVVEPLDLSAVVVEISEIVGPSIPKKVTLHLELERNLPPVKADGGQIQQVVMNLLLNAGEAIGDKTGLISVRTGVQELDAQLRLDLGRADGHQGIYVFLEVRDSGCGMDEATKAKIFDPFFTTKFTGRGLGLAAVAGILRGHNGVIKVSSEPGRGSCFLALLPAADGVVPVATVAARERIDLRGNGTVLVVDDEEVVREMARRVLERYEVEVLTADGGHSAIEVLKRERNHIGLVILDLSMPGMSGEEALREFRKIRPGIKVVVSSGYSEDETMRLFEGQTVSGFIQKPYTSSRLAEAVKDAIG